MGNIEETDSATLALLGKKQVLKRRFSFISMFGFAVCEVKPTLIRPHLCHIHTNKSSPADNMGNRPSSLLPILRQWRPRRRSLRLHHRLELYPLRLHRHLRARLPGSHRWRPVLLGLHARAAELQDGA